MSGDAHRELRAIAAALRGRMSAAVYDGVTMVAGTGEPLRELTAGSRARARPVTSSATPPVASATPVEVGQSTGATPARESLSVIREALGDCQRCKLSETRKNIVFGVGSQTAPLMFVGEAPGADEDRLGEPFVGRAGQLLDKMISAMGWRRGDVYIANVLKCRPPGNRNPAPDEVEACRGFLARQVMAIRPRIIVTLGKPAAHLVLNTTAPISALRGRFQSYREIAVMPTFHPAYLLRSPEKKRDTWNDLKAVMSELDKIGVKPPTSSRE